MYTTVCLDTLTFKTWRFTQFLGILIHCMESKILKRKIYYFKNSINYVLIHTELEILELEILKILTPPFYFCEFQDSYAT